MSLFLYHYSVEQFCGVYCSCLIKSFFIQWSMSLLHNSFLSTASGNHHSMFSFWELTFIDCILSEVREHYSCCTWLLLGNFISHGFKIYGKWHFYVLWNWMLLCYVYISHYAHHLLLIYEVNAQNNQMWFCLLSFVEK